MKVKELIEKLSKLPQDADVLFQDGDYQDSSSYVIEIDYQEKASWGRSANTVLFR